MHLVYPAVLAVLLFSAGLYGVLARRNAILVLMSVELMLAGVSLNLVAFDVWLRDTAHAGQVLTLFLIALSAAEVGIGLAIVLLLYRARGSSAIDHMRQLRDPDTRARAAPGSGRCSSTACRTSLFGRHLRRGRARTGRLVAGSGPAGYRAANARQGAGAFRFGRALLRRHRPRRACHFAHHRRSF